MTTATTAATAAFGLLFFFVMMAMATTALMIIIVTMTTAALVILIVIVTTTATVVPVVMTALTMDVTMSNLFGRCGAHIAHGNGKTQIHPGQRMVGINLDELFAHLNHSHRTVAVIGIGHKGVTFGDFHAVKQFTRHALHQIFIILAIRIGGVYIQLEAIASTALIQRLFQTRNQKTGAVQINQRLAAFGGVQYISRLVKYGVVEGYNAQMANFHVRFPKLVPQDKQRRNKVASSIPEKT